MGKLTELKIKAAKPEAKAYSLPDGGGLILYVTPKGGKWWRYRYRFEGLANMLSLGTYPDISLKEARNRHAEARRKVANGINPSTARKAEKITHGGADCFEAIAREWHTRHYSKWTPAHAANILTRLEQNVFPWLGKRAIKSITPPQLLDVLRRIEERGALETAHRVRSSCGQIFRYAVATGRGERDITQDIKDAIPPAKKKHMATITNPVEVGKLLRAIDGYEGTHVVRCALQLAPLLFVRPGELRQAEWAEIDWQKKQWVIPAEKMKMREQHIVPLSTQALAILQELQPLTGYGDAAKYLFPSPRTLSRPLSDNGILSALRRMGYAKEEMSGHGFRHMASTLLNEQGFNRDHIERQLAHGERNKVRATYNFAQYLPERTVMMQAWADYLDGLRAGGEIIKAKFGG